MEAIKNIINFKLYISQFLFFLCIIKGQSYNDLSIDLDQAFFNLNELNINKVSFVFDNGSFISVEKDTLKRKSIQFEYKAQDYFGMISGKVDTKKENYYVELVSKDLDNIYKNRSLENHRFSFKNIPPGSYYIRTIVDTNKNGRWDKGNIIKNIAPEEIVYFKTLLEVRSNWEVDNVVFNF